MRSPDLSTDTSALDTLDTLDTQDAHDHQERGVAHDLPRQRLRALGAEALSDAELVALLLRTGSAGRDALSLARVVLERSRGLRGLDPFVTAMGEAISGLGPAKCASLEAAIELGRRLQGRRLTPGSCIRGPQEIHRHFHPRLRDCEHEHFIVVLLDGRHRMLGEAKISQGTLTASLVHPREVFRPAVRGSAAALVLVHNHPSGDPTPSAEDRAVTARLSEAGQIVGIRIVDHVVVAEQGYFSFCAAGELDPTPGGMGRKPYFSAEN